MVTPRLRNLPFEPIEQMINRDQELSDEAFAQRLGITRKTLMNYRNVGMPFFKADRISCRLGHHPTYFWGDDYFGPLYENGTSSLLKYFS